MAYLNRVFDLRLKAHLKAMGAVLIEGPKWCGKTTTAKQLANSVISLQDTDHREEYLATAIAKPSFLLEEGTEKVKSTFRLKVNGGEIVVFTLLFLSNIALLRRFVKSEVINRKHFPF